MTSLIQQTEPHCTRMTVTPARAAHWLEYANTNNRSVRDAHVRQLARDMAQGRWRLTHEAITFDPHGVLLDGQHRLWAVVIANVPVEMHVWFGVTNDALAVIDRGKTRTLSDQLRLTPGYGEITQGHTAVLAAMVGGMAGPAAMTGLEAAEAMSKYINAVEFALDVIVRGKFIANATTRAVIARAYYSADHDRLRQFGEMLTSGVVPHRDDHAVILLRQFLYAHPGSGSKQWRERYAKTERALLAFLDREPIAKLYPVTREHFPLPEEASD